MSDNLQSEGIESNNNHKEEANEEHKPPEEAFDEQNMVALSATEKADLRVKEEEEKNEDYKPVEEITDSNEQNKVSLNETDEVNIHPEDKAEAKNEDHEPVEKVADFSEQDKAALGATEELDVYVEDEDEKPVEETTDRAEEDTSMSVKFGEEEDEAEEAIEEGEKDSSPITSSPTQSIYSDNPLELDRKERVQDDVLGLAASHVTAGSTALEKLPQFQPEELETESETEFDRLFYYKIYDDVSKQLQEERRKNQFLHKKVGDYYKRRKMHHLLQEGPITVDIQKKYHTHLDELRDLQARHTHEQVKIKVETDKIKLQYRNKDTEIKLLFQNLQKVELELSGLENRESTLIERCLKRQKNQLTNIIKMRLSYIKLKNHFNEKQVILDSLDNLGPGIRLFDYEQLKLDNRNLIDKYEEKEAELIKIRKKNQNSAQILAHIREKAVFFRDDMENLKERYEQLLDEFEEVRGQLNDLKLERDTLRVSINKMKANSGLLTESKLLQDMQKASSKLKQAGEELNRCKTDYQRNNSIVRKMRVVMNSPKKLEKLKAWINGKNVKCFMSSDTSDSDNEPENDDASN